MKKINILGITWILFLIIFGMTLGAISGGIIGASFIVFILAIFLGFDDEGYSLTTINTIGMHLSGEQELSQEYANILKQQINISKNIEGKLCMYTYSFVFFFLPVIPINTVVALKTPDDKYIVPLYYPCGKGHICWEHIKNSYSFYVYPAIMTALILNYIIGSIL